MFSVLNSSAQIMCVHGGRVLLHPTQSVVKVGGGFPHCLPDLMSMPIVGCTQVGPGLVPCTLVVAGDPVIGPSPKVLIGGRPAYVVRQMGVPGGMTNGVPPGMIVCADPGQLTLLA
jgi:hypothetical protein